MIVNGEMNDVKTKVFLDTRLIHNISALKVANNFGILTLRWMAR